MITITICFCAAFVHSFAILGYLSILVSLDFWFSEGKRNVVGYILRALLYLSGMTSIFVVPAYLYGQFKTVITKAMVTDFFVCEIFAVAGIVVSVKAWYRMLAIWKEKVV
jgi:hypothetical protein